MTDESSTLPASCWVTQKNGRIRNSKNPFMQPATIELNTEKEFLVKESKGIKFVFGMACLVVVFISLSVGEFRNSSFIILLLSFLLPGIYFLSRLNKSKTFIKLNSKGFYYYDKLITDWDNFRQASVTQDARPGAINDRFVLVLDYQVPGKAGIFRRQIPLENIQDKSEEEIIAAIRFFYKGNKTATEQEQNIN